jgi:hypothetical protein
VFVLIAGYPAFAQSDLREIIRQSIRNYQHDWRTAREAWVYTQKDITETDGKRRVEVSEILPLDGTPYERLTAKDGRALTPEEDRKEERKYEKALQQRGRETPAERKERIRKFERDRDFIKEIPEAYDFKVMGEEAVEGRPAWVVTMRPHPGFVPTTTRGALLEHITGKLWIDKEDRQWARAEAHVSDTINIGWIIARIEPGTNFKVEQTRIENGFWMPKKITISGAAHLMLVHNKPLNEELIYSGFHREDSASAEKRKAILQAAAGNSLR